MPWSLRWVIRFFGLFYFTVPQNRTPSAAPTTTTTTATTVQPTTRRLVATTQEGCQVFCPLASQKVCTTVGTFDSECLFNFFKCLGKVGQDEIILYDGECPATPAPPRIKTAAVTPQMVTKPLVLPTTVWYLLVNYFLYLFQHYHLCSMTIVKRSIKERRWLWDYCE